MCCWIGQLDKQQTGPGVKWSFPQSYGLFAERSVDGRTSFKAAVPRENAAQLPAFCIFVSATPLLCCLAKKIVLSRLGDTGRPGRWNGLVGSQAILSEYELKRLQLIPASGRSAAEGLGRANWIRSMLGAGSHNDN